MQISTIMIQTEAAVTELIFAIRLTHLIAVESRFGIESRGPIRLVEVPKSVNSPKISKII